MSLYICFSKGKFQFEITSGFSEAHLTLNRWFLRLSVPGELCKLPPVTPTQSTPRGKTPGLPAMPSFGAQSVPTRDPAGGKHRWTPMNGTTSYSRCLAQGAQHLRTPRTSRFEVSTKKHRLRLDAVAAVLAVRRWPTGSWKKKSCHHGGCWPLFPGSPGSLELLLASRASPGLLALRDFQRAFYPLGLSRRQIGAVPRIYLLAFQAERRYKQLT